jgi:hypothetical protein
MYSTCSRRCCRFYRSSSTNSTLDGDVSILLRILKTFQDTKKACTDGGKLRTFFALSAIDELLESVRVSINKVRFAAGSLNDSPKEDMNEMLKEINQTMRDINSTTSSTRKDIKGLGDTLEEILELQKSLYDLTCKNSLFQLLLDSLSKPYSFG